jgi:hypothetical protein
MKSTQQGTKGLKPALGGLKDSDSFAKQPKFQASKLSQTIQFDGTRYFSRKNNVSDRLRTTKLVDQILIERCYNF